MTLLPIESIRLHPINPGRAQLDMRKVMFTAGGPNYDRVLQETDVHIGADASNIPSELGHFA